MGLQPLMQNVTEEHIRVNSDNTATVSCINNMGSGKSVVPDDLTKEIWQWCTGRNSWLSCAHIAGADNVTADTLSRKFPLLTCLRQGLITSSPDTYHFNPTLMRVPFMLSLCHGAMMSYIASLPSTSCAGSYAKSKGSRRREWW